MSKGYDLTTDKAPFGLEAWADYLQDKALPVRVSILARLNRLVNNDNTTLQQLSHLVRQDPVLCLQVTRIAQALHREKGSTVAGIEHAVSSLGLDAFKSLSRQLQTLRVKPASMQQKMYFRAIADSQHASLQAAELCRQRGLPFVEEVRLAALLYGFVHWLLWLHAPLHKHEYQKRVLLDKVDVALAEQDILGCTAQALGAELARRWGLPDLTCQALDHATSPSQDDLQRLHRRALKDPELGQLEQREINQLTQQRFFPVKLGNWLALTTTRSWYSRKAIRLFDILADYLSMERDRLLPQLHSRCAEASRQYHVPGTLSPAAELLNIPSQCHLTGLIEQHELVQLATAFPPPAKPEPKHVAPPPETASSAATAAPTEINEHQHPELYLQVLQRLQTDPELQARPAPVLQTLLQGLHQGLGLARVGLLLINTGNTQLRSGLSQGLDRTSPLNNLTLNLEVPSLFKRLSEKPAGIWLNPDKRTSLASMLPQDFSAAVGDHDYLLMSIFKAGHPLAIIYADDQPMRHQLSEFQYDQFRQLCAAATHALKRQPG